MTGLVSLLVLAVAPAALADEANDASNQVELAAAGQSPAPPAPSTGDLARSMVDPAPSLAEQQIQELNVAVKALRGELARQRQEGPVYLPQQPNPWW